MVERHVVISNFKEFLKKHGALEEFKELVHEQNIASYVRLCSTMNEDDYVKNLITGRPPSLCLSKGKHLFWSTLDKKWRKICESKAKEYSSVW